MPAPIYVAGGESYELLRRTFRIDPGQVRLVEVAQIPKTAHGKTAYAQLFGARDEGDWP